jgi:hypothetical protein
MYDMALLCPNCGGDTVQDLPGNRIKCLECGKFSNSDGEVFDTVVDDPEQITPEEFTDFSLNPQVSDRVAAGVTSAIGAAFAPPAYDAPKGSTENDPAPAFDDPAKFATEAAEKMQSVDATEAEQGDPEPNVPDKRVTEGGNVVVDGEVTDEKEIGQPGGPEPDPDKPPEEAGGEDARVKGKRK